MSAPVELIETEAFDKDGLALIDKNGSVWRTHARPWWDLASHIWWWLMPGEKKWVLLRSKTGERVRIFAKKVAEKHVKIG